MEVTEERHGDVIVLRCTGAPTSNTGELANAIEEVALRPFPGLALDYTGLDKLTSVCVGISVNAFARIHRADGRLAIVHPDTHVWFLLGAPEFRNELLVCVRLDEALEFLNAPNGEG